MKSSSLEFPDLPGMCKTFIGIDICMVLLSSVKIADVNILRVAMYVFSLQFCGCLSAAECSGAGCCAIWMKLESRMARSC